MTVRKYSSISQETSLTAALNSSATTMTVGSGSALLGGITPANTSPLETFTVVIDPDTALEEIVDVTYPSTPGSNTITIVRGIDSTSGISHSAGAKVRHMAIGRDFRDINTHTEGTLAQHGATTSTELRGVISDETGTGSLVFATSPTLVTPTLGVATATSINGTTIPTSATLIKASDTGTVTSTMILDGTIVDADINASAAIAKTKLALTGTITSTDIANDTIVDGDINTAAAIAWTKIAPSSTVSATELGYLDGVTSAIQTQIDSKLATATATSTYAPLASPALTGTPTAPTATAGTNTTQVATTAYVGTAISNLVAGAPTTLDTLDEIAAAIADTGNFSDTVVLKSGSTMTGALAMGTNKITGLGNPTNAQDAATKDYIDNTVLAPSNLTGPITSVGAATSIASQTGTGTKFVVDTSPTLVTPVLGVATATSINGTSIPSTKTLVVTTDKLSTLAATTSAELAGVISDETGSGSLVFATSPTLVTPVLGSATGTSLGLTVASGTTVPLTIQNNGTGNSFVVNDVASDTTPFVIDQSGNIGIGVAAPTVALDVAGSGKFAGITEFANSINLTTSTLNYLYFNDSLSFSKNGTGERMRIAADGSTTINAIADGTTTTAAVGAGFMGLPQNSTTTGAYSVVAADAGKHIYSTATRTVTLPANSSVALPIGTTITFIAGSGATVTIAITTDTMYLAGPGTTGSRTLAAFGMATAVKIAATTWIISGNGLS